MDHRRHQLAERGWSVTTRTGTVLQLRPIEPDDACRLARFHQALSQDSVYRRFFSVHPSLSAAEVERFTHVDCIDRLALVVEDEDELVAVGRYDRIPGTREAEVAFVVADRYQHHGIATMLLGQLADAARRRGIGTFIAQTLAYNADMLAVFRDSGFPVSSVLEDEVVSVRIPIEPAT